MQDEKTLSQRLAEKYAAEKQANNPVTGQQQEDSPYLTDDEFADLCQGLMARGRCRRMIYLQRKYLAERLKQQDG